MDRRVAILAAFLVACFILLFAQLGNLQVRQSSTLAHSRYGASGSAVDPYAGDRGEILSADGYVLAKSVPSKGEYPYQRLYPQGSLFADITGYVNVVDANISTGLEGEYGNPNGTSASSQYLLEHEYPIKGLSGVLTERKGTDSITTTVSRKLQLVAKEALGHFRGAVVALDPQNGDILALYSNPSYDPNGLASHSAKEVSSYFASLDSTSGSSPLINGVTDALYAPGSTFKIITSSAIFDHKPSIASQSWPAEPYTSLPHTTKLLHNYEGEICGGDLAQSFAQSCDTVFGLIGLELGPQNLASEATAFGFNEVPPIDLPSGGSNPEVLPASFPKASSFFSEDPVLAYSAIGQENVAESPLENVLVAAAIADGGKIMTPHLLSHVVDDEGNVVETYEPHLWRQATTAKTAAQVRSLMLGVVEDPNGTAAEVGFPADLNVAAKTGTAQAGTSGCSDNWLDAIAPAGPGQTPKIAVSAFVPYQPGLACNTTGAIEAGPVVKAIIEAALGSGS